MKSSQWFFLKGSEQFVLIMARPVVLPPSLFVVFQRILCISPRVSKFVGNPHFYGILSEKSGTLPGDDFAID